MRWRSGHMELVDPNHLQFADNRRPQGEVSIKINNSHLLSTSITRQRVVEPPLVLFPSADRCSQPNLEDGPRELPSGCLLS